VADVIGRDVLVELVNIAGLDDRKDLGHQLLVLLALVAWLTDAARHHHQTHDND